MIRHLMLVKYLIEKLFEWLFLFGRQRGFCAVVLRQAMIEVQGKKLNSRQI